MKGHIQKKQFESKIICGDVISVLKSIPSDVRFDIVIADPPYNIGKDFENNNDSMPVDKYVEWSQDWINKCLNLLKDNGLIYIYGFSEILARISAIYPVNNQRWLIWHYTNKTVPSSSFWQRSHEAILCLWKEGQKRPMLEIDQIREPYTEDYLKCAGGVRKETISRYGGNRGKRTFYNAHDDGALPRDVIRIPALAGGAGASERWFMCYTCNNELFSPREIKNHRSHSIFKHPTQKPLSLSKKLLQSRIKRNKGSVLIPFAGSGSECVAAKMLSIDFLGIEINPKFVDFANKWLSKTDYV